MHRDVKPENVLISDRGQLKVADFGLAKAISSQTSTATQGLLIGTVSYLPPELVVSGQADARSDVYSAGVVLFELLTGLKPHTGDTPIQVAYAHVHKDVPAPSTFPTAGPIPPYLDALVARATARDASARPQDARVFLTQVRRVGAAAPRRPTRRSGADRGPDGSTAAGRGRLRGHPAGSDAAPRGRSHSPAAVPRTVIDAPPPAPMPRPLTAPPSDPGGRQRERAARKRRRGWLALLLVLMLTIIAVLAGWYFTEGRFTTAPALSSLSKAEAEQVATKSGLHIRFVDEYSETVQRGVVINTDPGAGTKVHKGSQIEAEVSKGPERFSMPTVVGLTQPAAEAAVQKANLRVGKVKLKYSETVAVGMVLGSSELSGASLKRDTPSTSPSPADRRRSRSPTTSASPRRPRSRP